MKRCKRAVLGSFKYRKATAGDKSDDSSQCITSHVRRARQAHFKTTKALRPLHWLHHPCRKRP